MGRAFTLNNTHTLTNSYTDGNTIFGSSPSSELATEKLARVAVEYPPFMKIFGEVHIKHLLKRPILNRVSCGGVDMTSSQRRMSQFLIKAHSQGMHFTAKMLEEQTGFKHRTIDTYIRKMLINYYIVKSGGEYITTNKLNNEGEKEFEEHMCQTHPRCKI